MVTAMLSNGDSNVVKWGQQCCQMVTAMLSKFNDENNVHGDKNVVNIVRFSPCIILVLCVSVHFTD